LVEVSLIGRGEIVSNFWLAHAYLFV